MPVSKRDDRARWQVLIAAFVMSLSGASLAGPDMNGNGGDVIYCAGPGGPRVRFYDAYEAEVLFGLVPEYGSAPDRLGKIMHALARLAELSPRRAAAYRAQAETFERETAFIDHDLIDIDDANGVLGDAECQIKQIAIQKNPTLPFEKRYTVDRRLWEALSENDRASLILHEIIYREAVRYGHRNSFYVRRFNVAVASDFLAGKTASDMFDLLRSVNFDRYEYGGLAFDLYQSGLGQCGSPAGAVDYSAPLDVVLHPDGAPAYGGVLTCGERLAVLDREIDFSQAHSTQRQVWFYATGSLRAFHVPADADVAFDIQGVSVKAAEKSVVNLHENGAIESAVLVIPSVLRASDGRVLRCRVAGSTEKFEFDQDGYVTSWPDWACGL